MDPSYVSTNSQESDMSYLFGRDPSILAYSQRPCVSKEAKKNLLSSYEIEEYDIEQGSTVNSDSQTLQTVKVYLRMKPFPRKLKLTKEQQDAYRIIDSTILSTRLPALDVKTNCLKRSTTSDIIHKKFTFTRTFGPETTQLDLFEQAVKPQMVDFLTGQNSTIMTYGTTNSGKSYTLQGTTTSPGIIPRCLEFVFSNITAKSTPSYKPINHCHVVSLDPLERAQELEIKNKLLTFTSVDKYQYINAYKEMQKLLQEESPIRPSQCVDAHYSVWVSFAEIYNEIVYDLLSNECQKKRTPLKLGTDGQGRTFIKGLKTICVNSGSEAYQVLMAGQYNLKVAATALNARSSRSHCIFTIKLLKYYKEDDPDAVEVSTFAFGDLAGSERLKKTLNIGDRLKEAQNINTSLLVFGRCLKTIHEGQLSKQQIEHVGPFRESKLTRLFQKALSGKEHMALIVNINPVPNLYAETENILNFSAIAKKIVIEQKEKVNKKKSRFSQIVTQSMKSTIDWDTEIGIEDWQNTAPDDTTAHYVQAEEYEKVLTENENLKKEIVTLKNSALSRDLEIRQEMADTYTAMMKNLEVQWKNRIKDVEEQQEDILHWSVKHVEEFYKQKLDQVTSLKKRRLSYINNSTNIEELEEENSRLTSKVVMLQNNVKELKETNQNLVVEKNNATFELGVMKEDLKNVKKLLNTAQEAACSDEETECYVEELKSQLFAKQEQVKKLKIFLNEAKEEYIAITTEITEKEYIIKEHEKQLVEKQETIEDFEADFESINICLTEKTKALEVLEEKVESQNKKIEEDEIKMKDLQDQLTKLQSEKVILLDEIELLKKTDSKKLSVSPSECKVDIVEISHDSLQNIKHSEIEEGDISLSFNLDLLYNLNESVKKNVETESEEIDPRITEKLVVVELENSALREKITRSTTEIQVIKEDLESAKEKLRDISNQIFNLKIKNEEARVENNEHIQPKEIIETVEIGCQAEVEPEVQIDTIENENHENDVHNIACQTVECITKEESNQTSFIEETDDDQVILDELAKLTIKYHDVKCEYKEACQRVDVFAEKITKYEHNLDTLTEFQQRIEEANKHLETCHAEKEYLQKMLDENNDKLAELESRLEYTEEKEREKDNEIIFLQKEMKRMIQRQDNDGGDDKLMETEIKNTIRELTEMKEKLARKEECIEDLQVRLKNTSEQNTRVLDLLQQSAHERQLENERLRNVNEELKNSLIEKEREMEAFLKNRDEMVTKYEHLVKVQQDELEKVKQDLPNDYMETRERRVRRPPKKYASPTSEDEVIELFSSESKQSGKRRGFKPPPTEPILESKKKTHRKKKLFTTDEESYQDIEPLESSESTTPLQTRSLRSRRK